MTRTADVKGMRGMVSGIRLCRTSSTGSVSLFDGHGCSRPQLSTGSFLCFPGATTLIPKQAFMKERQTEHKHKESTNQAISSPDPKMTVLSVLAFLKWAQLVTTRSLQRGLWGRRLMGISSMVCWTFDPGIKTEADPSSSTETQGLS